MFADEENSFLALGVAKHLIPADLGQWGRKSCAGWDFAMDAFKFYSLKQCT